MVGDDQSAGRVTDLARSTDFHRVQPVDRAADPAESHVLIQPVPADGEPGPVAVLVYTVLAS